MENMHDVQADLCTLRAKEFTCRAWGHSTFSYISSEDMQRNACVKPPFSDLHSFSSFPSSFNPPPRFLGFKLLYRQLEIRPRELLNTTVNNNNLHPLFVFLLFHTLSSLCAPGTYSSLAVDVLKRVQRISYGVLCICVHLTPIYQHTADSKATEWLLLAVLLLTNSTVGGCWKTQR